MTHLTGRRWEGIPVPVPGFPLRDTDADGEGRTFNCIHRETGGGSMLGGLVPRDQGAGATVFVVWRRGGGAGQEEGEEGEEDGLG